MKSILYKDFLSYDRGTSFVSFLRLFYLNSGFKSVALFRLQSYLYTRKLLFLSYLVHSANLSLHGLDIQPGCQIGQGVRIEHPVGIVLGAGTKIGSNCTILQGVTVGVKHVETNSNNSKYPTIGNHVILGAKATILGAVSIGDKCIIGAHSLVLDNFQNGKLIVGAPAKEVKTF